MGRSIDARTKFVVTRIGMAGKMGERVGPSAGEMMGDIVGLAVG